MTTHEKPAEPIGPGPDEPIEDRCPVVREGMEDEPMRKRVQAAVDAGRTPPRLPLPPGTPPDLPDV